MPTPSEDTIVLLFRSWFSMTDRQEIRDILEEIQKPGIGVRPFTSSFFLQPL
jgi:hypothetical protein